MKQYKKCLIKSAKVASNETSITIIGGGISGSTIALQLAELGCNVTLLEKDAELLNGPPMCHLHAGGNLYPELSDEECSTLLQECIDFARYYPAAIDKRPTVLAIPKRDSNSINDILARLKKLSQTYQQLVMQDPKNQVLGEPKDYYRVYDREDLEHLKLNETPQYPHQLDHWMIPVAKNIDLDVLKMPLILVQEYGLNKLRLASMLMLALDQQKNCAIKTNSNVLEIKKESNQWCIIYSDQHGQTQHENCDYLINAAGFKTGEIDDLINVKRDSMVEFKAAYLTKWHEESTICWPEVIFYGQRGTPYGLAQLTPFPDNHFVLHGMTQDITLFDQGLVKNERDSAQPQLPPHLVEKMEQGWEKKELEIRTQRAIQHISYYIPKFASATPCNQVLFGAQQIPSNNPSFRTATVSFSEQSYSTYARCEVVKASAAITASRNIISHLMQQGLLECHSIKQNKASLRLCFLTPRRAFFLKI